MDCLASIVKYILYLFNLLFVLCGLLLIIVGSIILSNVGSFSSFEEAINTETIPIIIIILGCVIFVISFFGCCGAIKENNCCTMIYAVFMFILFCLQIALVVWIFVKRQDFLNTMGDIVEKAWQSNNKAEDYPMDVLQLGFKCCGVTNYVDYTSAGLTVPSSCCGYVQRDLECPADIYTTKPGCKAEFISFWSTNMNIIRYAGIGIALVELVAFSFACCLANNIRRSRGHKF